MSAKQLALVAMTYDQDLPHVDSRWSIKSGKNAAGQEVPMKWPDLLNDYAMSVHWHWPPEDFVKRAHDLRHKVAVAQNMESIAPTEWQRYANQVAQVQMLFRLRGTNGLPVDIYEKGSHTNRPAWAIELWHPRYAAQITALVEFLWNALYRNYKPDFVFFDVLNDIPYYGSATNAPPVTPELTANYQTGWRAAIRHFQAKLVPVLGHRRITTAPGGYPSVGNYLDELGLQQDPTLNLVASIKDALLEFDRVAIGITRNADIPAARSLAEALDIQASQVLWQTYRSGGVVTSLKEIGL